MRRLVNFKTYNLIKQMDKLSDADVAQIVGVTPRVIAKVRYQIYLETRSLHHIKDSSCQ